MPVLSVIMTVAETDGLRPEGSNPCRGIRRYRRQNRDRFLSEAEIVRLGRALCGPSPAIALIRLLALTGCRSSEIRTLRWADYRDGHIFLRDSKTGPRTVWLSGAARTVLDALPRTSPSVFPAFKGNCPMSEATLRCAWCKVRTKADLKDVACTICDIPMRAWPSQAGETILAVGRLLGHRDPETTLKYATTRKPMRRRLPLRWVQFSGGHGHEKGGSVDGYARKGTQAVRAEYSVQDKAVPSLSVRVYPTGTKTWACTVDGRKLSLGRVDLMPVEDARRECLRLQVDGITPGRDLPTYRDFAMVSGARHGP